MRLAIIYRADVNDKAMNIPSIEDCVNKLSVALNEHGHATSLFPMRIGDHTAPHVIDSTDAVISLTEIDSVAKFMSQADEYDLVHIHGSITPVFFSLFSDTPLLLTLDPDSAPNHSWLEDNYSDRVFIVWTSDSDRPELPNTLGVIPVEDDNCADQYLAIYDKILAAHQREDHRPWGYYKVLSDLADHKVKRIVVYPGKRLSLQRHRRRSEHWVMISGVGVVTLDSQEIMIGPGKSIDIPVGVKHRIRNPEDSPCVFIEIQTGDYFGEDDIERFEDDFGRV